MNLRPILICMLLLMSHSARAEWLWIEGEKPIRSTMNRHPWWYDQVKKDQLSGGDWISNFDPKKEGEASYKIESPVAGDFEFWVHANPTLSKLSYRLDDGEWVAIDLVKGARNPTNIAADGKPDLRFIAWARVGTLTLGKRTHQVSFRMSGEQSNHGGLDCFVLSTEPFVPRGLRKPGEAAVAVATEQDWFPFDPSGDSFEKSSIDLRYLNEPVAGDGGFITARDGQFVHEKTGKPVRFWAINGPSSRTPDDLRREARQLAKYGVNLVRVHGPMFDKRGEVDPEKIRQAWDIVTAMKAEGIYTHFSIYFPLWFDPPADLDWMPGYDGKSHAFATLYFHRQFQEKYRGWWRALLTTPHPQTGRRLSEEPAVFGAELINEDSLFFWTFNDRAIPGVQLRAMEEAFGRWAIARHGSLERALQAWKGQAVPRDSLPAGRLGFRPLWNIANERSLRDQDTAAFLAETQSTFYATQTRFLRDLGFRGLITASNWVTASPEVLGPLEKRSYMSGDFIDRHGYFGCRNQGDASEWSLRDGHTYVDRSAWRFESEEPGKPASFVHPAMDPHYGDKPSMISETTWNRPNRHRGEAPIYLSVYGALQDSDAIVHFAKDGIEWSVKPGYFMQPWTLLAPTQFGQFPAAALIYRQGLVASGDVMATVPLGEERLRKLQGTPLPQDAAFDELRLKDVPHEKTVEPGQRLDPLIHYVGRTHVTFPRGTDPVPPVTQQSLSSLINVSSKTVRSSTGELSLDWGRGVLTIDAPSVQGASGDLRAAGVIPGTQMSLSIPLDIAHVLLVSLDARPLTSSQTLLLQVMTEEKPSGFRSEPLGPRRQRIVAIGDNPWLVRKINGSVTFRSSDAGNWRIQPLDHQGRPRGEAVHGAELRLLPDVIYYRIETGRKN